MKNIALLSSFILLLLLVSCSKKEVENVSNALTQPVAQETIEQNEEAEMTTDENMQGEWNEEEMEMMNESSDDMMDESPSEEIQEMNDETTMNEESMDESMMEEEEVMKEAGSYEVYDANLVGASENTVIFFHANWCPSCRAADTGISGGEIPAGLTILKADFDTQTDLRKKYGVVAQHTFVQVDADGNQVAKWLGGTSVEDITKNLK